MRRALAFILFFIAAYTRSASAFDANSTVFVILMENHNWADIKGSASAPYLNGTLLPMASYCDQYYNPPGIHPSEPNYIWLEAGSNLGILDDNPPSSNAQSTTNHFATLLKNAGISWKTYLENITGATCPTTDSYPYAVRHNPFAFFTDVTSAGCTSVMRPFSELANDLANNNVARYNFITPNVINDMHDTAPPLNDQIKQGDTWLQNNLPAILNSQAYQNGGLILITWDEGENGSDGPIGMIALSPQAKGGGYHSPIRYTHSAALRTLQKIFGVTPFIRDAANGNDLGDLFLAGAIPNADLPPTVVTTSAFNVAGGNATLGGSINPNGDASATRFEYGLTSSYGADTRSRSADDAEGYASWAYDVAGGTGLGPIRYREGTGGGIYLEAGARRIDGVKSFGLFSGGGAGNTQAADRSITNPKPAGVLTLSARFDVNNSVAFSGFNLKYDFGTTFGFAELISVGIRPGNGNNTIAVNGGAQTINLGSDIRGQIVDFSLSYDCVAGTYLLGAKFRASSTFQTITGPLKVVGQIASRIGFGNFNTGNTQNVIFDSIQLVDADSAGNGMAPVTKTASLTGLTPNTTYHYRAVAQNSRGISYGADQTFGFPLTPPVGATFQPFNSTSGNFQARIYNDSGYLALAMPDLAGNPLASIITLAPANAKIGGATYDFGRVQSVTGIANGMEIVQALAGTTITAQLTFKNDGVMHYEVTNWNGLAPTETNISAASDASEHFYGFGEKFNSFDQAGKLVHMLTWDPPGAKGDQSYKPVPWFMSTRGYGFQLDSSAESNFDMRSTAADRYSIQNLLGALKFNLIAGPKLTDVLPRFTNLAGRPPLPPPWAFGTWISSDIWRNGGEVRYAVTKYLQNGIPASVFVFDSPWETAYNDFNWNMTQWSAGGTYEGTNYNGFSSLGEMMEFFRSNGLKVVCWLTPFINTSSGNEGVAGQNLGQSSNYAAGAASNYFVRSSAGGPPLVVPWWKGNGSPVDFTNASARTWFSSQLTALLAQSNVVTQNTASESVIGGFKTDDGETSNGSNTYIPTTAVYADGRTGVEMRNGYCVEYHKTVSEVLGSSGLLFARSGFTGTQRYPAGWAGDNEPNFSQTNGLQSVIVAGESAAMSGFALWSHDIGGYQNSNFETNHADLFMRWAQFGALSPLMQMHRQVNASNLEQYPWGYGATALANYVSYTKLHSQLFPYLYSYAKKANTDGLPIIRPLVLMEQTDINTYGVQHTYHFGDELLVAPMNAANATARTVYLPAGNWYDFWTSAKYTGGALLNWSNADATKMPLFVREGAIVPMLPNAPQTLCNANYVNNPAISTRDDALLFLVYPAGTTRFDLYDGTSLQSIVTGNTARLTLDSIARPVTLKILTSAPAGVERDGLRLPQRPTQSEFDAATFGWRYDSGTGFLFIKLNHSGGQSIVTYGPDSLGHGVTDSWRQYYGVTDDNADDDGDGFSNRAEYRAGTNPTRADSRFTLASFATQGSGFSLGWFSQLGIDYRIQWKNQLSETDWQTVGTVFTGNGTLLGWTDDGSQTGGPPLLHRFYRLAVP